MEFLSYKHIFCLNFFFNGNRKSSTKSETSSKSSTLSK